MTITQNNVVETKISKAGEFIANCVKANMPIFLVGSPGIGKTYKLHQVAEELNYEVLVEYCAMCDPTDPKGIPFPNEDKTEAVLLPIGIMAQVFKATKPTILFLDDLGNAPPAVQTPYMHILYGRVIAGRKIPDCVSVVAATNRLSDKSNVYAPLGSVNTRFSTILHITNTVDDFIQYAHGKPETFSTRDISFIRYRPDLLNAFEVTNDFVNCPTPRTWENCAKFFRMYDPETPPYELIVGAIGEGAATERMGFERIYNDLPNPNSIINDPKKAEVPSDPAVKYALCGMLGKMVNKKNAGNVFDYFERLGGEFDSLAGRDAVGFNPAIIGTKGYKVWLKRHPEITM